MSAKQRIVYHWYDIAYNADWTLVVTPCDDEIHTTISGPQMVSHWHDMDDGKTLFVDLRRDTRKVLADA